MHNTESQGLELRAHHVSMGCSEYSFIGWPSHLGTRATLMAPTDCQRYCHPSMDYLLLSMVNLVLKQASEDLWVGEGDILPNISCHHP